MTMVHKDELLNRLQSLDKMPTLPVVLVPLLRYLEQPIENLEVQGVVDLISKDKSLAAQCLQLANSPLFGRPQSIDSIYSAVLALGMQRMCDIAVSCSVLKLAPQGKAPMDPVVFWEHSLGCALLSRRFAAKIGFADPAKAYLAALLHDIGIIANLSVMPREFARAYEVARTRHISLHEAEMMELGLTHGESGRVVAEKWRLAPELAAVVGHHHAPQEAPDNRALVALVSLADLLCRMTALSHGFTELRQVSLTEEAAFHVLLQECPGLHNFDWALLTFELEGYLDEVRRLVTAFYRPS
jgi:putative nucleotidyltransferase with HDIG domain